MPWKISKIRLSTYNFKLDLIWWNCTLWNKFENYIVFRRGKKAFNQVVTC